MNLDSLSYAIFRNYLKIDFKKLNIRAKMIQFVEENIRVNIMTVD